MFVYHEDDILFKHHQLVAYLFETKRIFEHKVARDYCIGFQRYIPHPYPSQHLFSLTIQYIHNRTLPFWSETSSLFLSITLSYLLSGFEETSDKAIYTTPSRRETFLNRYHSFSVTFSLSPYRCLWTLPVILICDPYQVYDPSKCACDPSFMTLHLYCVIIISGIHGRATKLYRGVYKW